MYGYSFNAGFKLSGGGVVPFDPDAQAFITAASITDPTQQSAVNTTFVQLKADGIWTKIKGAYILKLGSATNSKFNIKNPLDTDAAFRLSFLGGWGFYTGTNGGAESGAVNSHCETFFNVSTHIEDWHNDHHMGFKAILYTDPEGEGWNVGIGNTATGDPLYGIANKRFTSDDRIYDFGNISNNGRITDTETDARGFYIGSTTASNNHKLYKDGASVLTSTNTSSGTVPNGTLWFAAINPSPSGLVYRLATRYSFFTFGYGLTPTEAANYTTIINTLLAAL